MAGPMLLETFRNSITVFFKKVIQSAIYEPTSKEGYVPLFRHDVDLTVPHECMVFNEMQQTNISETTSYFEGIFLKLAWLDKIIATTLCCLRKSRTVIVGSPRRNLCKTQFPPPFVLLTISWCAK